MSDFFTRLAERTLGLALTIQPIKPSLFAPELDYDDETSLEFTNESEVAQAFSGTAPVAEGAKLSPDGSRTAAQERTGETSVVHTRYAQGEQLLSAAIPVRQSIDALAVTTPIDSNNGTRPRRSSKQHQPAPQKQHHIPSARAADAANTAQVQIFAPDTVLPYAFTEQEYTNDAAMSNPISGSTTITNDRNTLEHSRETTTLRERSTLRHEHTIAQRGIVGSGRSRQSPIPISAARPEAAMPEPTIQVTIGRVEVRAVSTPAPTPRSQSLTSRPTAMSLDEYLRRQEQGGRR